MSVLKWPLHWQVLLGIVLGCFLGYLSGTNETDLHGRLDFTLYGLLGGLFMNALKMLIIPLVMSSIIQAIANMGQQDGFARMGLKTLLFYSCTSFFAIVIGLFFVNTIQPGKSAGITANEAASAVADESSSESKKMKMLESRTAGKDNSSMLNVFRELIPSNIFKAMAEQKMLGVIVFSLLFGYFLSQIEPERKKAMLVIVDATYDIMTYMTFFILRFLPLGVLCLIAQTASETFHEGNVIERLLQLSQFAVTVLLALGTHALIVLPAMLLIFARVNPFRHFKTVRDALLTAFSTASSSATLPLTMECVEKKTGVSKKTTSFVLPVGATVNMDGTALYECVAVMFLAQLSGIHLDASAQFTVVLLALLTSIGVAGIPSASLVAIVIILNAVNQQLPAGESIPMEALAIILIFDRLLDMCRTTINVLGDTVCAVVVARSEGEKTALVD